MSNTVINPKPCNYGCNTRIYWDTSENAYFEVFTKKRHSCPNRSNNKTISSEKANNITPKPNYYNHKSLSKALVKPKMDNSFELLDGPITDVQRKYEILTDLITEYNGKTHGSQSHIVANNSISFIVYYEVPEGKREEVKRKFDNKRIEIKYYH